MDDPFDMGVILPWEVYTGPPDSPPPKEDPCSRCGTAASNQGPKFGSPVITCYRCGASAPHTKAATV